MKFSIPLLSLFIIGSMGLGAPFASDAPIPAEVKKSYGLTWDQLSKNCNMRTKGPFIFKEIDGLNSDSGQATFSVAMQIVDEARKKSNVIKADWDKWIQKKCVPNGTFKTVSTSVLDKVQECVDEKRKLSEKKKKEAQGDLLKLICQEVFAIAQEEYNSGISKNWKSPKIIKRVFKLQNH